MRKGEKLTLSADLLPKSLNSTSGVKIIWSADQENILAMTTSKDTRKCTVQAIGASGGSVQLTAKCNGYSKTITVNVKD